MLKRKWFFILVILPQLLFCSSITKAYDALSIYDYFKAKQLFYKTYNANKVNASYGLATIFYRNDNPFSNIDSAAKYIAISKCLFVDTISFKQYKINSNSINTLANDIADKGYDVYCRKNSIENLNYFLNKFYFAEQNILEGCLIKRDQIILGNFLSSQSSDSVNLFLLNFPESKLYKKAQNSFHDFEYLEQINIADINSYKRFLKKYQKNYNIARAEENLFEATKLLNNEDSLFVFLSSYSTIRTQNNAWKHLYNISVKAYSKKNLETFISKYPQYPYRNILEKEMNLAERILIPIKSKNHKYGYVDTLGNWFILPRYDDALDFSEGFASVCENDTCFYINKEGLKISDNYFEETENYVNGVAIVKNKNSCFLINRSGQIISKPYQEINPQSESLFVCKEENKYGAINSKAEIIIPFIYNKLGDFKNGFAYYLTDHYGLVNQFNKTLNAEWDWISDIDTNKIAVVSKAKKYGLINYAEEVRLAPQFDYITHCQNGIYLIVKDNKYGFYNGLEKCFVTDIEFEYNSSYASSYYSNGKYFKLLNDDEVALIDGNGRYSIPFGMYSNLFFAKCDLIRIQKNNKYGFVDRKLKQVTPIDFTKASDFDDCIAVVEKSGISQLINPLGKVIYAIKGGTIKKINKNNYKILLGNLELFGLINNHGEVLLQSEFSVIEPINEFLYRCEKPQDSSVYLYNSKNKTLKKTL